MSRSDQLMNYFLSHRKVTNELVNKIDERHYDYKPTETSMSAHELVSHMLTSFYRFVKTIKEGNAAPMGEKLEDLNSNLSQSAELYTEKTKTLIASLTDEELNRVIELSKIFGMDMKGKQLLQMAMDHEINHKGNLFVYVREMGQTDLPMFISRG